MVCRRLPIFPACCSAAEPLACTKAVVTRLRDGRYHNPKKTNGASISLLAHQQLAIK
jgi:hypothetical protein